MTDILTTDGQPAPQAHPLADAIRAISEYLTSAGWHHNIEWTIREELDHWRTHSTFRWGSMDVVPNMRRLDVLQRNAKGWVWWRNGPEFVTDEQWEQLRKARNRIGVSANNQHLAEVCGLVEEL